MWHCRNPAADPQRAFHDAQNAHLTAAPGQNVARFHPPEADVEELVLEEGADDSGMAGGGFLRQKRRLKIRKINASKVLPAALYPSMPD